MFTLLLQIWGGLFYLLNKLFFSKSERTLTALAYQKWRMWAWAAYLFGLPPWIIIFVFEHNWIAAVVETSGAPAMLIGLHHTWRGQSQMQATPRLDLLAKLMILFGLGLSLYDFRGLTTINQIFELGIAFGVLLGTYLLAKERPQGYFWLMVGNINAASLMLTQGYYILMIQQIISFLLVFDAYWNQKRRLKLKV